MRYGDRITMMLDATEKYLEQMKDAVDAQNVQAISSLIVALGLKIENIRNLIELEEQN
jgi:phosphoribosylanthranilate isomerase|tara:strand:- start:124 stop:297 length:174 start_codon:yes stop_codon:yes gene_type:complete